MSPNFICIGAQKAGTSWLWNQLRLHPEIWVPPNKELHYFDRFANYPTPNTLNTPLLRDRLKDSKWASQSKKNLCQKIDTGFPRVVQWWSNYLLSDYSDEWYLSLFSHTKGKLTGEITPSYSILSEQHVAQMAKLLPDTKIIFLLRNPIDRAWSMLRFSSKLGEEIDFADEPTLIQLLDSDAQNLRSDYERTIELYTQYFGKDKILLGFYDAILYQPETLITEIFDFIGVSETRLDKLNLSKVANASPKKKMPVSVLRYLQNKYKFSISSLSNSYGSYCDCWLQNIQGNKLDTKVLRSMKPTRCLSDM